MQIQLNQDGNELKVTLQNGDIITIDEVDDTIHTEPYNRVCFVRNESIKETDVATRKRHYDRASHKRDAVTVGMFSEAKRDTILKVSNTYCHEKEDNQ